MASKATLVNGEERPAPSKPSPAKRQGSNSEPNMFDKVVGVWKDFTGFLRDVRGEMRKVVAPSRKEVQVTTSVVIVTVFLFGVFFFVVDFVFRTSVNALLNKLIGLH
ncbi:MAG TPA: preprotein translocase subunit SecE [Terracidiphilus sp.]|nr:preprotein translocase subunit SecE [Terracidiphilus sp.]